MDFETMLKLVNAGFTKEEIMNFTNKTGLEVKTTEPEVKTPEPEVKTPESNDILTQLTAQITDLAKIVKDMQSNNVKNAKIETPKETNALDAVKSFFGDVSIKEGK
jgi:hypothetical protein